MLNRKAKLSMAVGIVVIIFILTTVNFDLRLDRFGAAKIHWIDCVQINSTKYYRDSNKSIVKSSEIGNKIGEVTFNVSEKVGNPKYRFRDGDATFLNVGTEIYIINKIDNSVAAKVGEQYYLYNIKE